MRIHADYLSKSRHGIWYYRWAVPEAIRRQHPELPKELKRSTRTADTRLARGIARRIHLDHLQRLYDKTAMNLPRDLGIRAFEIELDPKTGRPIKLTAEAHEADVATRTAAALMEAAIAREQQRFAAEQAILPARDSDRVGHGASADVATTFPTSLSKAPVQATAVSPAPAVVADVTLSEAFDKYAKVKRGDGSWASETMRYTHEPSIRVFRELVGRPMTRSLPDGTTLTQFDLPVRELTPTVVEKFVEEFRQFPTRQGKRPAKAHARAILSEGGPPQSIDNFFKRLEHVQQFLRFCVEKNYISEQTLTEVTIVTRKNTQKLRNKAARERDVDGIEDADGCVAFTQDELKRLFGPTFAKHARRSAARYWIPLMACYTGMRVAEASQLRPEDFVVVDEIPCVRIRGGVTVTDESGQILGTTRVKTAGSRRTIPLHPALLELGLLDYVATRRAEQREWMWDGLIWEVKSGFGRYPSRDFSLLAKAVGVHVPKRKVLHSFRSTLAQALEKAGMEDTLIDRFIGHDVATTRSKSYSRTDTGAALPITRMFEVLKTVRFSIDVDRRASIRRLAA